MAHHPAMAMAGSIRRPTFKVPDPSNAPYPRPSSPIAPSFEPLSPRPTEQTFGYPQPRHDQRSTQTAGAQHGQPQDNRKSRKHDRTPSTIHDLANAALATSPKPPRPYPLPQSQSHSFPKKAQSVGHLPQYTMPQYPMPQPQYSPTNHYGEPAAKRARSEVGPSPHQYPASARPTSSHVPPSPVAWGYNVEQGIDRARRPSSNAATNIPCEDAELLLNFASRVQPRSAQFPSPVKEPSAQPVLSPPAFAQPTSPRKSASSLAQTVSSPPTLTANTAPAAQAASPPQLASSLGPSAPPSSSLVTGNTPAVQAVSPPRPPPSLAPSVLPPPTLPANIALVAQSSAPAEPNKGTQEDPSASFPSPRDISNNQDEKTLEPERPTVRPLSASASGPQNDAMSISPKPVQVEDAPPSTLVPQQTRTPPEEESLGPVTDIVAHPGPMVDPKQETVQKEDEGTLGLRQSSLVESVSAADTSADTDSPKSRPRRGWPKGKPRGPRNKSNSTKPRSTARRSRASAKTNAENGSTTSGDDMAFPAAARRKSESDLTALLTSDKMRDPRSSSVPPNIRYEVLPPPSKSTSGRRASKKGVVADDTICSGCSKTRESSHGELDQWIGCNGCKGWFHYDCAGFKNERDVRDVDKFFCKSCEPQHGATTFVRKSTRTHTNVDYAGLNQGILKTSDEDPAHHYVQPIKDGTLTFDPETFPRMRPELVTAEYFETCSSFVEPILIPAEWNPKRQPDLRPSADVDMPDASETLFNDAFNNAEEEEVLMREIEYETAFDDGQDKLGMVIPQGLTVRHVSRIVGPEEPLEVIDVKTQGTEGKWNLGKFADYYEADGEKAVRNVISLEVSHTKLGNLLQRPKVVRQIDLQDSVWPAEESAKGNYPKVQFYCLMSVADSFTDFHIDFGGSSVYYHILRGRKTFFFIPPKPSHLKAYEDWNNSPEQNFTWLPNKTKECYRVDLYEGDTMLIPSGWIHAVWTPTNSLVIGGNFLTRLHYSTQFRIVDIEKANKTPLKFRYPQFQKVMWYTVIKYLETDPLPSNVAQHFYQGNQFHRERPIWQEFFGDLSETGRSPGMPDYNARYYSQAELDGLPELISFIFRTVMISLGRIEGVSEDTRKKVVRSIPKSHGDPLDVAKAFALWVAWKRGDEDPPAWAHPDADLPDKEAAEPKKLSARALKQLQRQEAINAYKLAPDRHSARQQASRDAQSIAASSPDPGAHTQQGDSTGPNGTFTSTPKTSVLGPKRVACDACRKRRIRCKHKEQVTQTTPAPTSVLPPADSQFNYMQTPSFQPPDAHQFAALIEDGATPTKLEFPQAMGVAPMAPMMGTDANGPALVPGNALLADPNSKRGRSKACLDCRKSKRRCVHDEHGQVDPVKAEQTPVPRGVASKRRSTRDGSESPTTAKKRKASITAPNGFGTAVQSAPTMPHPMSVGYQQGVPPAQFQDHPYPEQSMQQQWPHSSYMYPDPMDGENVAVNNGPYHQHADVPYSQQTLEQLANDVLDSRYVNNDEDGGYTVPQHAAPNNTTGVVQSGSYSLQQQGISQLIPQSHHSSDSGVAFPDGQMMGGPVQDYRSAPEAVNDASGNPNGSKTPVAPTTLALASNSGSIQKNISTPGTTEHTTAVVPSKELPGLDAMNGGSLPQEVVSNNVATPVVPALSPQLYKSGLSGIPLYEPPLSASDRRSSRASLPVERFSIEAPQQNGRRRSSASKTPVPMDPPESQVTPGSARKRKRDSTSAVPSAKKTRIELDENGDKNEAELTKLAREMQGQDWGLRRRSREA